MKLNLITLVPSNPSESEKFYTELIGLKVARKMDVGPGSIVFLANKQDETMIEILNLPIEEKASAKGLTLTFESDESLELIREKAIKLGYQPSNIIDQGSKPRHFSVTDPDGLQVEFM